MRTLRNICFLSGVLVFSAAAAVVTVSSQTQDEMGTKNGTITICHATESNENPYNTITVSDNGKAHRNHSGDVIPAPAIGCPGPGGNPPIATPEPVTMLLFGVGIAVTGYAARRSKQKGKSA